MEPQNTDFPRPVNAPDEKITRRGRGALIKRLDPRDFENIREGAAARAEALVKSWIPDGRREGDEWDTRNPTRADMHPGSFKINLRTGQWADFASGDKGGDLIALRAYLDGSSQLDAAWRVAEELGLEIAAAGDGLTLERYAAAKDDPLALLKDRARRAA